MCSLEFPVHSRVSISPRPPRWPTEAVWPTRARAFLERSEDPTIRQKICQDVHDQALAVDSRWHVSRIKKIVRHRSREQPAQTLTLAEDGSRPDELLRLQALQLRKFLETQPPPPPAPEEEEEEESKDEKEDEKDVPSPELVLTSEISPSLVDLSERAEYSNYKGSLSSTSSSSLKKAPPEKKKSSESSQGPGKAPAKASGSGGGSGKKESSGFRSLSPSRSEAGVPKPVVKLLESEGPDTTKDVDWQESGARRKSASPIFAHEGGSF
jgi:hypothetical protein